MTIRRSPPEILTHDARRTLPGSDQHHQLGAGKPGRPFGSDSPGDRRAGPDLPQVPTPFRGRRTPRRSESSASQQTLASSGVGFVAERSPGVQIVHAGAKGP